MKKITIILLAGIFLSSCGSSTSQTEHDHAHDNPDDHLHETHEGYDNHTTDSTQQYFSLENDSL